MSSTSHSSTSDALPPMRPIASSGSLINLQHDRSNLSTAFLTHSASNSSLALLANRPALIKQQSVLHKPQPGDRLSAVTHLTEEEQRVVEDFRKRVTNEPETAIAVAAIQTLTTVVRQSTSQTIMGLEKELNTAVSALKACNPASISLAAGCELFSRYVSKASLDTPLFIDCVARLIERGEQFSLKSKLDRQTIASLVDRFISDGKVVLTHGFSRVVQSVLIHAAQAGKNFSVLVTEGRPSCDGYHAAAELVKAGIPVTLILDSAMAYSMDQVDLVLIGAEGVAESGGIINKIGTFQMCLCATTMKKPVYVAAESYKFARLFPLNQDDLPETKEQQPAFKPAVLPSHPANNAHGTINNTAAATAVAAAAGSSASAPPSTVAASAEFLFSPASAKQYGDKLAMVNPSCDYTPPQFLTLLFTDIGILTPSAVSDELIKLYYNY